MAEEPEDRGHLRPVKIHGLVLDEHGGGRPDPPSEQVNIRLVRELKRVGAAPRTLTGCPVEQPLGRIVPGPGAEGTSDSPAAAASAEPAPAATGIVRFLLRLLGREVGLP